MAFAVVLSALGVVAGIMVLSSGDTSQEAQGEFVDATFSGSGETLRLEVARTRDEIRTGLMNRSELQVDGMLFVMPREETQRFWMKNTLIPLDMIFLDSQRRVVNIEKAYPPESGTPDSELERYRSEEPAKYVVELEMNRTEELGIRKGNRLSYSTP
jgi:uncharacterized membrane protein (UPF0127 family)